MNKQTFKQVKQPKRFERKLKRLRDWRPIIIVNTLIWLTLTINGLVVLSKDSTLGFVMVFGGLLMINSFFEESSYYEEVM